MTKIMSVSILNLILLVCLLPEVKAQNSPFNGTIVYDISSEGNVSQSNKSMMPSYMIYKFLDNKQSMALNFAMVEQRTIFDADTKIAKVLMDLMGKKIVIKQTAAEVEALRKEEGLTISIKETKETKTIAGITCKKVILIRKMKDGREFPSTVYYTDAMDISKFKTFNAFPEIKGVPLEFSMKNGDVIFKVTARTVKKENISPSEFVVSPEYQEFSIAELQKLFGNKGLVK